MKKIFFTIFFSCTLFAVKAQQEPQYALYMFAKQALNPAAIGSRSNFSGYTDFRSQWTRVDGGPETFSAGVQLAPHNGAEYGRHAGGLLVSHDRIGVSRNTSLTAQYAYRMSVSVKTVLSFGVQATMFNYTNNLYQLRAFDPDDQVQTSGINTNLGMNTGAGVYLYSERFFAGVSIPQLLENEKDLRGNELRRNKRHMLLMGGYLHPLNEEFRIRASALSKYVPIGEDGDPVSADINLSLIAHDRILGGVSWRSDNTISAILQLQLSKTLNIGYSYDFKSGNYGKYGGPSHEIFLGFDMNSLRGPFTTPRFVSYF